MKTVILCICFFISISQHAFAMAKPPIELKEFVLDDKAYTASKDIVIHTRNAKLGTEKLGTLVRKYNYHYDAVRQVILKDNPDAIEYVSEVPIYETYSRVKLSEPMVDKLLIVKRGSKHYRAQFIVDSSGKIIDYMFGSINLSIF